MLLDKVGRDPTLKKVGLLQDGTVKRDGGPWTREDELG